MCVDLLDCDTIVVVHHTDCGGQAAVREHSKLMGRMHEHLVQAPSALTRLLLGKLVWYASYVVPSFVRRKVGFCVFHFRKIMSPQGSVRQDPMIDSQMNLQAKRSRVWVGTGLGRRATAHP